MVDDAINTPSFPSAADPVKASLAPFPVDKRQKIEAALAQLPIIRHGGQLALEWQCGAWRILALMVHLLGVLATGIFSWSLLWSVTLTDNWLGWMPTFLLGHALFITYAAWSRRPALRLIAAANGLVNGGAMLTILTQFILGWVVLVGLDSPGAFLLLTILLIFPSMLIWLNWSWMRAEHRLIARTPPEKPPHTNRFDAGIGLWCDRAWRVGATLSAMCLVYSLFYPLDAVIESGMVTIGALLVGLLPGLIACGLLAGGIFLSSLHMRLITAACLVVVGYVCGSWCLIGVLYGSPVKLGFAIVFLLSSYSAWRVLQVDIAAIKSSHQGREMAVS